MSIFKILSAITFCFSSTLLHADVPNRFINGDSISAAEFNENFTALNAAIDGLSESDSDENLFLFTRKVDSSNGLLDNPIYTNSTGINITLKAIVYDEVFGDATSVDLFYDNLPLKSIIPNEDNPVIITIPPGGTIVGVPSRNGDSSYHVVFLMEKLD